MNDQAQSSPKDTAIRIVIGIGVLLFILQLFGGKKRGKRKASLKNSQLRGVDLSRIKLSGAKIANSDLREANLSFADLSEAQLRNVNLKGANLREADLEGAALDNVRFNKKTTLPDGSSWANDVDMARFTDHDHPEFWRSEDEESPAYVAE